ncbi:hypothetical protein QQM39_38720 [Streptomyces sp. DT2A-34]|uniref:hypothetical protein n=1 Tax=Streptomyces sp. DT2A-34 TaxID=3051182 RepID=UPI00265C173F|nr:hypothetical protein [Streptomyces sp. DT2A-34]MDO0916548.1 hypothetical protein [Streptomyces sp. DT2A-34]
MNTRGRRPLRTSGTPSILVHRSSTRPADCGRQPNRRPRHNPRSRPVIHRRDVSDITAQAERDLLAAHQLNSLDLIATGTEAKVYLLDAEQVLKVYADPDGTQAARLQTLRTFYDHLDRDRVPYALPVIHAVEQHGPLLATREALLPGRPMGEVCDLTTPETEALYLDAVTALGALPPPGDAGPARSWPAPARPAPTPASTGTPSCAAYSTPGSRPSTTS